VQSTGEGATYTRSTLDRMLDVALSGIAELAAVQSAVLADPHPKLPRPAA
jgi:ribonuclease PH